MTVCIAQFLVQSQVVKRDAGIFLNRVQIICADWLGGDNINLERDQAA
jgi:hypothetical protein